MSNIEYKKIANVLLVSAATIIVLVGCANIPNTTNQSPSASTTTPAPNFENRLALYSNMRKLWTDHVVWTRDYIIAAVAGAPDAAAASTRLLKNQEDIGKAIAVYYGADAGNKLTDLLKQHILIAVDLINASKAKDQTKFDDANSRWNKNANQIADFLSSANPSNWPQQTMRDMMAKHLSTTTDEVTARLNKNYDNDVKAYDAVFDHILTMSDALSKGIINQFPEKF